MLDAALTPVGPIDVLDLFAEERADLLALLSSLDAAGWAQPTVCAPWSVKDLAAHLLADDLGIVSRGRDGYAGGSIDVASFDELIAAINAQNQAWADAMRRLSPRAVVELLEFAGDRAFAHFRSLDLDTIGDPVNWAGPGPAAAWLDVAREYTERWAHGQQIRDALGRPGLFSRRMFAPVLDAYVRALPHTFRDIVAPAEVQVVVDITGDAGGVWTLVYDVAGWALHAGRGADPRASVTLDQDAAWRLFTKGLTPDDARRRTTIVGDPALGAKVLETVSILA